MSDPRVALAKFLEAQYNHIVLPPCLPGFEDKNLDAIGNVLTERLIRAASMIASIPGNEFAKVWKSLRRSLRTTQKVNTGGSLSKSTLLISLDELRGSDFIGIYVAEQNAVLLIRRQNDETGESVIFEAFESSPRSEDVLVSTQALAWDFPGYAVTIPTTTFDDISFRNELAGFLEKASIESVKRFAARTDKARSSAFECRNTADPGLITQMLMTLLEVNGSRAFPPTLRKRVRDDVSWVSGGIKPWRRSPIWLLLRVATQRHLCLRNGDSVSYKFLISVVLSNFLNDCLPHLSIDLSVLLKTKLCRRLAKLEVDRQRKLWNSQAEFLMATLRGNFEKNITAATNIINDKWESLKQRSQRPIPKELPQRADDRHLRLTLPNSWSYIQKVLRSPLARNPSMRYSSLYELPQDYQFSAAMQKQSTKFAKTYFKLSDIESTIERDLKKSSLPQNSPSCARRCIELSGKIRDYLKAVGNAYDDNPGQKSIMLLTVMELWIAMDKCAVALYGLLRDFDPGFPSDILNVLQLSRLKDIIRLGEIRSYLQQRIAASNYPRTTIFHDPQEGCFAQRYYNESLESFLIKQVHEDIDDWADEVRSSKKKQWEKKSEEYERLITAWQEASHENTIDENHNVVHDRGRCTKCYRHRVVQRHKIEVFEDPIPSDSMITKVLMFELQCPEPFAVYRDTTWNIISNLALPAYTPGVVAPVLLRGYGELYPKLKRYVSSKASTFVLASRTKSFLDTHYSHVKFPVALDKVCVPSGLTFSYLDAQMSRWPEEIFLTYRPSFAHHCNPVMPSESPFSFFNDSPLFESHSKGPTSYGIMASQSHCPAGLNLHEFLSFQALYSGKSRRWPQILMELGSSNINFSTDAAVELMSFLALQVGPNDSCDILGVIHSIFRDKSFCEQLVDQIEQRLNSIMTNWRETNCMDIMITFSLRLFEIGGPMSLKACKLLDKARLTTMNWVSTLRLEIQGATDMATSKRCSQYAFLAAMLCRRTYAIIVPGSTTLTSESLDCFIQCSIALQNNIINNPAELPRSMKALLIRDYKLAWEIRYVLRTSLLATPAALFSALSPIFSGTTAGPIPYDVKFHPSPDEWWVQMQVDGTDNTIHQWADYNLLEGHLLVMGKPVGKLPPEWTESVILKYLFGDQNLLTYPSNLPGMTYMISIPNNNHQIHLGFRDGVKIARARVFGRVVRILELIPPEAFGTTEKSFDLPLSLVEDCVHWLDLKSEIIEVRQRPNIWKSRPANWIIDLKFRRAERRGQRLVDPQSLLFQLVAQNFRYFEQLQYLTIFQPEKSSLTVELRRLELTFYVNENQRLESPQLKSEIDPVQDAGTWYGLQSKLILQEVNRGEDPDTGKRCIQHLRQRSILVPMGEITSRRHGPHVGLFIKNDSRYARFTINDILRRLECPAEPVLFYLKAMLHAYTSFVLPDRLTGRTGTEEAFHCLRSGHCQPWAPLDKNACKYLENIASLTPRRDYYPEDLKVMQITYWNQNLTTCIQHDGFRTLVEDIKAKSDQLAVFSQQKIDLYPLQLIGDRHLRFRSLLRRRIYERNIYERASHDELETIPDPTYAGRDRNKPCPEAAVVAECTNILRKWPPKLTTTCDLEGILKEWPQIQGFCESFENLLITNLLELELPNEWGSLVLFCIKCGPQDVYKLMFTVALIGFQKGVSVPALRTLLAFAILSDLKTVRVPSWPSYTEYGQCTAPKRDSLVNSMKKFYDIYDAEEKHQFGPHPTPHQRRQLLSLEISYKQEQEKDANTIAEHLLSQWPCAAPTLDQFEGDAAINLDDALEDIYADWLRLFQNHELRQFVSQVQAVLDRQHATEILEIDLPKDKQQHIFLTRNRGGEVPTLAFDLFTKSNMSINKPIDPDLQEDEAKRLMTGIHIPTGSEPNKEPFKSSSILLPLQPPRTKVTREINELREIINIAAKTNSIVQQRYADDLSQSLNALEALHTRAEKATGAIDWNKLKKAIEKARLEISKNIDQLCNAFIQGDTHREFWLKHGGLWPSTSIIDLLEHLRSTSTCILGPGMKRSLIELAISVTKLQRFMRIEYNYLKKNDHRLREEQENRGHLNWQPNDRPEWLLLEIDSNIMIRPGQIDVAEATISPISRSNCVLQMNMGQGKTSCIIPMAAAVLADAKSLVRVIVPKALLAQTAQLLHSRLGGLLGRELKHIPFSRKTSTDLSVIESFHKLHQEILTSSGVIIALPEHLLSFKLSGLQRLADGVIPEASCMVKVHDWMVRRARDILDECDNILALRTQLIYPSGTQKTVDGHPYRWEVVEALLYLVDSHIHHLNSEYPNSIQFTRVDHGGFPLIYSLRKDVEDKLLSLLVEDVYTGRAAIIPECSLADRLTIKDFISKPRIPDETTDRVRSMFPEHPALIQKLYLLRGLLVHRILLMTLKRRWNVQYGLHPTRAPIAVPYHAKGCPSDQSEWGHPDVAILFTCLAFYYEGLSASHLRQTLEQVLKSDDPSQVYDRFAQNSNLPDALREWSAINVDDEGQIHELLKYTKFNVAVIDYFLNNFVFPRHAKQFQVKLQTSGWDIPLASSSAQNQFSSVPPGKIKLSLTTGFSGTNDWKRLLPLTIHQRDLPALWHVNAEVITHLLQPRNRKYVVAAYPNGQHLTEYDLLRRIYQEGIKIFIDAGAQILEMDNLTLVKTWLEIDSGAKAAVYFNKDDNRAWVYYRHGLTIPFLASPFVDGLEDCLVYLDEAHTRGTDLKMPLKARGALTLGPGQTKDHTVQAAMRLRQLATTQSITIFSPPEVHQSILELRQTGPDASLSSFDVIVWLIEQTCRGIEQLQPLYNSQGVDFCRRAQAALDDPRFLVENQARERYLRNILQVEQQSLEQLYGPHVKTKSLTSGKRFAPVFATFVKELDILRKNFQDMGAAVSGSALQEVEQERENENEVEVVREVQKPVHYVPLKFPGLHKDIISFAETGRLVNDSKAYELAFSALSRSLLGKKYGVTCTSTSWNLHVSTEFIRTVVIPGNQALDHLQRHPAWVLWSSVSQVALIVIPEEAEKLLPLIRNTKLPKTHLLTYSAPVTRKMLHFNLLKYYAVPSLPSSWEAPIWLRVELGFFAGRLYFDYYEYNFILQFLGVKDESGKIGEDESQVDDEDEEMFDNNDKENQKPRVSSGAYELAKQTTATTSRDVKVFARKPLTFLQEWLALRRKGQDFSHTPMGFICQGKPLLASHSFFSPTESNASRNIQITMAGTMTPVGEEEKPDEGFYDEHTFGIALGAGMGEDKFDDAQLESQLVATRYEEDDEEIYHDCE